MNTVQRIDYTLKPVPTHGIYISNSCWIYRVWPYPFIWGKTFVPFAPAI